MSGLTFDQAYAAYRERRVVEDDHGRLWLIVSVRGGGGLPDEAGVIPVVSGLATTQPLARLGASNFPHKPCGGHSVTPRLEALEKALREAVERLEQERENVVESHALWSAERELFDEATLEPLARSWVDELDATLARWRSVLEPGR